MSAYSGDLKKGEEVYHHNTLKRVKDWYFTADPDGCHNSDLIVIQFTDGTTTRSEGFSYIEYKKKKQK